MRHVASVLLLAAFLSSTCRARAAATKITLAVTKCEASLVLPERLFEYARAEMAPHEIALDEGQPIVQGFVAQVRLCHGSPNTVLISISAGGTAIAERVVEIADVIGDMRARTLAVALAELFAATSPNARATSSGQQTQLRAPASSSATPAPVASNASDQRPAAPLPSASEKPAERERERDTSIEAGAVLRLFFQPQSTLLGPFLALQKQRVFGEFSLMTANKVVSSGTVSVYDACFAVAYALLASRMELWSLRARAEAGLVWAVGDASRPGVAQTHRSAFQGAGALEFASAVPLERGFALDVRAQTGFARGTTATADGQSVLSTAGFFAGFGLGLSLDVTRGSK